MILQNRIETKLQEALSPSHLEIENESRKHHVPPGAETHFKLVVVSAAFEGLGLVEQHRQVHALLKQELEEGVHSLALKTMTPTQWEASDKARFKTPPCAKRNHP